MRGGLISHFSLAPASFASLRFPPPPRGRRTSEFLKCQMEMRPSVRPSPLPSSIVPCVFVVAFVGHFDLSHADRRTKREEEGAAARIEMPAGLPFLLPAQRPSRPPFLHSYPSLSSITSQPPPPPPSFTISSRWPLYSVGDREGERPSSSVLLLWRRL